MCVCWGGGGGGDQITNHDYILDTITDHGYSFRPHFFYFMVYGSADVVF